MKVARADEFVSMLNKLPTQTQRHFLTQEQRFIVDRRDTRLHVKKFVSLDGVFSLRITRTYRALFYFTDASTAVFFAIGHRKDIYR